MNRPRRDLHAVEITAGQENWGMKMKSKITYWKEGDGKYLGYLNDYPHHWTQGESFDDLVEHLRDLHHEFQDESLPGIRKVEEIEVG